MYVISERSGKMNKKEDLPVGVKMLALDLSKKWYKEDYGGYHGTADEMVEEFILWLYVNGGEIKC